MTRERKTPKPVAPELKSVDNPTSFQDAAKEAKTETVFEEAQRIIYSDRERTYGHPAKNLNRIAELWTQYLQPNVRNVICGAFRQVYGRDLTQDESDKLTRINGIHLALSAIQVCHMMQLLKWSRDENSPRRDNVTDDLGYGGLVQRLRDHKFKVSKGPAEHWNEKNHLLIAAQNKKIDDLVTEVCSLQEQLKVATAPKRKSSKLKRKGK